MRKWLWMMTFYLFLEIIILTRAAGCAAYVASGLVGVGRILSVHRVTRFLQRRLDWPACEQFSYPKRLRRINFDL